MLKIKNGKSKVDQQDSSDGFQRTWSIIVVPLCHPVVPCDSEKASVFGQASRDTEASNVVRDLIYFGKSPFAHICGF